MIPAFLTLLAAFAPGATITGQPALPWNGLQWLSGEPKTLADLRGRVVLVRWWTAPHCPFCKASSIALNDWHEQLQPEGLTVIGLYHHKVYAPLDPEQITGYAEALGFKFSIAIDNDWATLKRWWLDGGDRRFTSVSFLIDRQGIVRHIHPGGDYVAGDEDYATMDAAIRELLAE